MSVPDPVETIAEVIGGIDYDYEQRDQARRIVSAIRTSPPLRRSLWLALTADNPLSRLNKAPSSPVETTGADSGTTSYTGVIRPADEAEARFLGHCPACVSPMYGPCGHCIAEANAAGTTYEVQRLKAEAEDQRAAYGFLEVEVAEQIAKVAERNATIERMGNVAADTITLLTTERDEERATLARVEELAQSWRVGRGSASWLALRAVLAAKP